MTKYYFLICSLPKVEFGEKTDLSHDDLCYLLDFNLSKEDLEKIKIFKTFIDLKNVKALWQNQRIDARGNLNEKRIEEALLIKEFLPSYLFDFMQKYSNLEDRIKYFPFVYASFWQEEIKKESGFLHDYFKFEMEYRLIVTALRAKDQKRDFLQEVFFADQKEFLISCLQKGETNFDAEYQKLQEIYEANKNYPEKIYYAFLKYQFQQVSNINTKSSFDINAVLKFLALLYLAEEALNRNSMEGKQILNTLC